MFDVKIKEKWERETLSKALERSPERKSQFVTSSNIPVERLYTPADLKGFDYERDLGFPGEYPYTRGVYPTMYRGNPWTIRMTAGYGAPRDASQRIKYLLEQGETGLGIVLDNPTLLGLDSDDPRAEGEVGKGGIAIDSLQDMEDLYEGIDIEKISSSLINVKVAYVIFAMYLALAEKRGIPFEHLRGSMSNDPIRECMAMSGLALSLRPSVRLTMDSVRYCAEHLPKWNPISIAGYHIREWGITAVQEVAFTLARGIAYLEEVVKMGLDVDKVAPLLAFYFDANTDIFEEVAKFRAARKLWARIVKEKFGAKNPNSMRLKFHTQTAGHTLTRQQPENNIIRITLQALAAVLGGTQSLHTNSWDEAHAIPSDQAVRTAVRTQQIIAEESGVTNTIDPLAGSYYVESLTNKIEDGVLDYFSQIETLGGVIPAVESGFFQREIIKTSYERQRRIDSGEEVVIGVNKYVIEEEQAGYEFFRLEPEVERRKIRELKELKRDRDNNEVRRKLDAVKEAASRGDGYVMPCLIDAARVYATQGEMVGALKEVFGEYKEDIIL